MQLYSNECIVSVNVLPIAHMLYVIIACGENAQFE